MYTSSFKIYNASAGSGKTYTLVKRYLLALLSSNKKEAHKHLLAITFTNKAVAEMKERIISSLQQFSSIEELEAPSSMFTELCEQLKLHPAQLQQRSKDQLKSILHNYAFFDVSTIDRFTHRVIRTFAYDLKLPLNFEVELDTKALVNEAVDLLIAKAGKDKRLTKVLIDFALEKADDDKSWDIAKDLNEIGSILLNENDYHQLMELATKELDDFMEVKKLLGKKIKLLKESVVSAANEALRLIQTAGIDFSDFDRSSVPKYFQKIADGTLSDKYEAKWQQKLIDGEVLYPKKVTSEIGASIDGIQPQLASYFTLTKEGILNLGFLLNFYKHITPLSVLNALQKALKELQEEQNLLMISEFNRIISETINDQPAPFIYERLGERYRNYFIDEFQDTSAMQWNNLIPLIGYALEGHTEKDPGSLLLVGDAKQSIYRWRGGKAEQFMDLYGDQNPFFTPKSIENLATNFRSFDTIINFNNDLFSHLSQLFKSEVYKELYLLGNDQGLNHREGGCVRINFIEAKTREEEHDQYPHLVLSTIQEAQEKGFSYGDICILTRRKADGAIIADYLMEHNVPIISSETLLINRSPKVQFIVDLLRLLLNPRDQLAKMHMLEYLTESVLDVDDSFQFYQKLLKLEQEAFFNELRSFEIGFEADTFFQLPLYEGIEQIIRSFSLVVNSDAYVQYFLDLVMDQSQKGNNGLSDFLRYWDQKKDQLSIITPEGQDAVQMMTIHKSKGLEFPVVLFPYADVDIYKEIRPTTWFPIDPEEFGGLNNAYLSYGKALENYSDLGKELVAHRESQKELDNINLLYVALTRAVEQLHIFSKKDLDRNGNENLKTFSGFFINYLKAKGLWKEDQSLYEIGNAIRISKPSIASKISQRQESFISVPKEAHKIRIITKQGYLWDTEQAQAIAKGNLIHDLMSKIKDKTNIDDALLYFRAEGTINETQASLLKEIIVKVVSSDHLKHIFETEGKSVYNERDIYTKEGKILRPDRVVIDAQKNAFLVDYKTGSHNDSYVVQLSEYADALIAMGYFVQQKLLIYINDEIAVVAV